MKFTAHLFLIIFTFLISACSNEDEIPQQGDPEKVAVAFFDALYNQKNVKKAAQACSPQLARIVLHYHSPQAVARHLFNMSYDSVEVKPDDSGVKVREQFKEQATITLFFEGMYQGNKVKDVKRLYMIQRDGQWVIDKILKDPF